MKLIIGFLLMLLFSVLYTVYDIRRTRLAVEYQFIVTDDSLTVYDSDRVVGTIRLEGQLDSLITKDNE